MRTVTLPCSLQVYKVGNFFAKKNTETMKEILERTIRREAKSQVKN